MSTIVDLAKDAARAMRNDDDALAEQLLVRIVTEAPEWDAGHIEFGLFLLRKGQTEGAIERLRDACRVSSASANSFFVMAGVLHNLQKFDGAARNFKRAILVEPANHQASVQWGRVLLRRGEPQAAVAFLKRDRASVFKNRDVRKLLVEVLFEVAFLKRDRASVFKNRDVRKLLVEVLFESADHEALVKFGKKSAIWEPLDLQTLNLLAFSLLNTDERNDAMKIAKMGLVLGPEDIETLRNFALIAYTTGERKRAEKALLKLLNINGQEAYASFWLGRALFGTATHSAALSYLSKVEDVSEYREKVRILRKTAAPADFASRD